MSQYIIQSIHTPGDGNCFYYAFLQCILERQITKEEVIHFKTKCASLLTEMTLLPYCKEEVKYILAKAVESNKELSELIENKFDESVNHPEINKLLFQVLQSFRHHIALDGVWPDDWAQQYCAKIHKVNILVYMDSCGKFTPIFELEKDWPFILIFNKGNSHWESGVVIQKKESENDKIIWKHSYENIKSLL
jgi:hypothetical protein